MFRMQLGLERILVDGGFGAYSTHFGAVATTTSPGCGGGLDLMARMASAPRATG